jgi:hypothetical protein
MITVILRLFTDQNTAAPAEIAQSIPNLTLRLRGLPEYLPSQEQLSKQVG